MVTIESRRRIRAAETIAGLPRQPRRAGDGELVELDVSAALRLIEKRHKPGAAGQNLGVGLVRVVFVSDGADGCEIDTVRGLLNEEGAGGGGFSACGISPQPVTEGGRAAVERNDQSVASVVKFRGAGPGISSEAARVWAAQTGPDETDRERAPRPSELDGQGCCGDHRIIVDHRHANIGRDG